MNARRKLTFLLTSAVALVIFTSVFQVQAATNRRQPDPDHPAWMYYQLGLSAQSVGEHPSAIRYFSLAVSLAPQLAEAYEARADSYVALEPI